MKKGVTFHIGVFAMIFAAIALVLASVWLVPTINPYVIKEQEGMLINPVLTLSDTQALEQFDSSYVFFLLYSVKAYQLHARPFSTLSPRLLVVVGEETYSAEVVRGVITVSKGTHTDVDIIIHSTKQELIRLLRSPAEIPDSFVSGTSRVELVASHATLFSKGYLRLYDSLYDSSITGNAIRILGS